MNLENGKKLIGDWALLLRPFLESPAFDEISKKLKELRAEKTIYPEQKKIFRAFRECQAKDMRVLLLCTDPFPVEKQANGLALSIEKDEEGNFPAMPASLVQFLNGIEADYANGLDLHRNLRDGDMSYLCSQGVCLLNANLSVEEKKLGSHSEIWKEFNAGVEHIKSLPIGRDF